jgi:hypothetical protein
MKNIILAAAGAIALAACGTESGSIDEQSLQNSLGRRSSSGSNSTRSPRSRSGDR